ncbi:MAG: hypothetical protein HUU50_10470 [Candidatus Brocadiae bacterium]|nr:hypothetical protein [Candidatus Brocadiia bacterium]
MKKILFLLFFCCFFCFSQNAIAPEKIFVYPWPSFANTSAPFCVYGLVDAPGDYEEYYLAYRENTSKIEDDHYKRKEKVAQEGEKTTYHLVFTHWVIGELFRLEEIHEKVAVDSGPMMQIVSYSLSYPGLQKTNLWMVRKCLLEKSKSSWVGDKFKHLQIEIAFINMGQNRTRIYLRMELDAEGKRSLEKVEQEAFKALANILQCKKLGKK